MVTDSATLILQIVFGAALAVFGLYYGIIKQRLTVYWGRGSRGLPFTLTGSAAVFSGSAFIIGGGLLILGAQPQESGLNQVLSAVGCATPIIVFGFSFFMQLLIGFGKHIYVSREKSKQISKADPDAAPDD